MGIILAKLGDDLMFWFFFLQQIINVYGLLTKHEVKIAECLPSSSDKKDQDQYQGHFTEDTWSMS